MMQYGRAKNYIKGVILKRNIMHIGKNPVIISIFNKKAGNFQVITYIQGYRTAADFSEFRRSVGKRSADFKYFFLTPKM